MNHYLSQLRPLRSFADPEIVFEINHLEIEASIKQDRHEDALNKISERLREAKRRGSGMLAANQDINHSVLRLAV